LDVADAAGVEALAASIGPVDLLCLNAGVTGDAVGPVWASPPELWSRVLDTNLGGVVNGLRAFVPRMLATGREHRILVTASLAGLATWEGGGPYAASKHAVVTVAEQAALALADTPVTVTVLCPALVRSGMSDVGADPSAVAAEALAATEQGRFAVVPPEWAPAVVDRAQRLVAGRQPSPPQPSPP
jgi:NAD(P)-dependent dehydrogenase (short-subunit alcohol dehydrogenase family)